jgi:hypothetical protein
MTLLVPHPLPPSPVSISSIGRHIGRLRKQTEGGGGSLIIRRQLSLVLYKSFKRYSMVFTLGRLVDSLGPSTPHMLVDLFLLLWLMAMGITLILQ